MMADINWNEFNYFKSYEFDDPKYTGSGDLIDINTLKKLESLRIETGWPIKTHWAVGGCVDVDGVHGHSSNSCHLLKNGASAVDFHFDTDASPRVQLYHVINSGFCGIGCYYDWHWDGKLLKIGFHVDNRDINKAQVWKREKGKYIYLINVW